MRFLENFISYSLAFLMGLLLYALVLFYPLGYLIETIFASSGTTSGSAIADAYLLLFISLILGGVFFLIYLFIYFLYLVPLVRKVVNKYWG